MELRVREVLEEKLDRILQEFGVDKLSDVLDSEEGGVDFEDLYVSALLTPEEAEFRASELVDRVRERAAAARDGSKLLGSTAELDTAKAREIADHQLPYWTERMTVSYLRMAGDRGGQAVADDVGYQLRWLDGEAQRRAVFTRAEADHPGTTLLSLEHPRVRGLTARLPHFRPRTAPDRCNR